MCVLLKLGMVRLGLGKLGIISDAIRCGTHNGQEQQACQDDSIKENTCFHAHEYNQG